MIRSDVDEEDVRPVNEVAIQFVILDVLRRRLSYCGAAASVMMMVI